MTAKILLVFILAAVIFTPSHQLTRDELSEWELFKIEYPKNYRRQEEEDKRRDIFVDSLKFVRQHNALYMKGRVSYRMTINTFADRTAEDMVLRKGYRKSKGGRRGGVPFRQQRGVRLPNSVDWRAKGAVTEVKDQGSCGSCWAFSATGSLEAQNFLKSNKLVSLSEQNLMDCSGSEGNYGCDGGLPERAFDYIKKNNGIDTEVSYPYEEKQGTCRYMPRNRGATSTGYVSIPTGDESQLQAAVATKGPISVAIDASAASFSYYQKGVYRENRCSSTNLDHAVLLVGYGTTPNGEDYWLIKNSWGKSWGMNGYMMMARNNNNMCGIATEASYPLV